MNDQSYQIGEFGFNRLSKTLSFNGDEKKLSHKPARVLELLFESDEKVVSRDFLISEVWDDNFLVGDKALTTAIWTLRKEFEDSSVAIETIPKEGYRLSIVAKDIFQFESAEEKISAEPKNNPYQYLRTALVSAVILIVFLSYVLFQGDRPVSLDEPMSENWTKVALLSRSNLDSVITNRFIDKLSQTIDSQAGTLLIDDTDKRTILSRADKIAVAAEMGVKIVIYVETSKTSGNLISVSAKYQEVESGGIAMASWQVEESRLDSVIAEIVSKLPGKRWQ